MRIAGTILLTLLIAASGVAWSGCGVTFNVPEGWRIEPAGKPAKGTCAIGVSPKGWKRSVANSRWDDDAFAVHVTVLHGTFAAAAKKFAFEKDEKGEWGVPALRGVWTKAEAVRYGPFRGWRGQSLSRGFAREGAVLGESSRVYSTSWFSYLLHDGHGTIICVQYNQWNPDIKIDRAAAANTILSSLARSAPQP
ncbi:MAG TPA: hypothetical protein VNN08_05650 [Thermoanaerobaculia bacterium]|nr:hypothetical protein [Thermoanaerobaculia bacterium]